MKCEVVKARQKSDLARGSARVQAAKLSISCSLRLKVDLLQSQLKDLLQHLELSQGAYCSESSQAGGRCLSISCAIGGSSVPAPNVSMKGQVMDGQGP